jgi:hypothetical protein
MQSSTLPSRARVPASTLPALFGYDPVLLAELKPKRQRAINLLAEAWIISSAMLAAAVGYALWLVEHSLWLSLASALGMGLVVVNLLRLVVAGSGAAPHLARDHVQEYRPALGPTFVLSMLAVLLAQPAQLPLWQAELAGPMNEHRANLLEQQEALARELGQYFRQELSESDFLAWRVREIWKDPQRAFILSALYWLLVLLPTLAGRFVALSALREYELARWKEARAQIQAEGRAAAGHVQASLAPYPSYRAPLHAKLAHPFDTTAPFLSSPTRAKP